MSGGMGGGSAAEEEVAVPPAGSPEFMPASVAEIMGMIPTSKAPLAASRILVVIETTPMNMAQSPEAIWGITSAW